MPERPTFDKICALFILMEAEGLVYLSDMKLYSVSDDNDPTVRRLEKEGYYLLDVGKNKYQRRGTGSAVETVCRDFNVTDPILLSFVEVANRNNASGYLKAFPHSVVYLLREAYKVGEKPVEVIERVLIVLDAHLRAKRTPKRKWEGPPKEVAGLLEKVGKNYDPFTLSRFIREAWIAGFEVGEIKQEIEWWLRLEAYVQGRQKFEKRKAEEIKRLEFTFLNTLSGCWVNSDDTMLARALWPQGYSVVVVKRSTGNVAILTRKQDHLDVSRLCEFLNTHDREQQGKDVWVYDPNIQACLNGSHGWRMPRTRLSQAEIIAAIQQHIRRR